MALLWSHIVLILYGDLVISSSDYLRPFNTTARHTTHHGIITYFLVNMTTLTRRKSWTARARKKTKSTFPIANQCANDQYWMCKQIEYNSVSVVMWMYGKTLSLLSPLWPSRIRSRSKQVYTLEFDDNDERCICFYNIALTSYRCSSMKTNVRW